MIRKFPEEIITMNNKNIKNEVQALTPIEVEFIHGASFAYELGYAVGYVLGGGAGRDLGNWLYDATH